MACTSRGEERKRGRRGKWYDEVGDEERRQTCASYNIHVRAYEII